MNAPPATMTSPFACAMRVVSPCRYSTPVARRPESTMRLASALRDDREIGPAARLAQIADRGRAAASVARRELEIAGAFLGRAVEIIVARKARLLRGRDECLAQRMRFADIGHGKRPAGTMQRVLAPLLVLGAPEIGQDILEAPAGIAELPPVIEIFRLAADIEQPVDRARPAQHLAARLNDLPVVELGLGLRAVEPVDLGVVEQLAVAERDVDPDVAVLPARLQQENAMPARGGQTVGEHAARSARADDDVVERVPRVNAYSMASSERACSVAGISMPSALAVFRLITSSNVVGCMTGRSAGLAPFRMRPA